MLIHNNKQNSFMKKLKRLKVHYIEYCDKFGGLWLACLFPLSKN